MKKQIAAPVGMNAINKKVLDSLGAKKQSVGKTIFRLSPPWEEFLRTLATTSNQSIRDFLDSLAAIAKHAHSAGALGERPFPKDGERRSYAISEEAKETFTKLAHECGVSRDSIVQSALAYILIEFEKNALTAQKKIEYARILEDARDKMLDIYYSERVSEARERLCATGDPDFADCEKTFAYIERLNDLDLEPYIRRKQNEADEACS